MRDENKNLDAFFSTRLQNETIGEDGWNMPPDDIWNAARTKFIDRKKPRRRFIFWLLIPLLALCLSIPLKMLEGSDAAESTQEEAQFLYNDKKEIATQKQYFKSADKGAKNNITIRNDNVETEKDNAEIEKTIKVLPDELEKHKSQSIKKEGKNKKQGFEIFDAPNSDIIEEDIAPDDIVVNDNEMVYFSKDSNNNITERAEGEVGGHIREVVVIASLTAIGRMPEKLRSIKSTSEGELLVSSPKVGFDPSKLLFPLGPVMNRNEIGISHTEMLLNLALAFDVQSENGRDEYQIGNNYFNTNITGRKWINKKWSLNTGVHYFNLDLDVNFSVFDTLDNDLSKFINKEFNEITSRSTIEDQEKDFVIDLIEGANTELGDELNLKGDVNQKVRAIQVPLFLDYHIYKGRLEYIFGFGVSIEYLSITERLNEFKIYKDDERISKPVNLPVLSEKYFDGSVHLKSGIRYKITDQFNLGLDAKINLLGLPFSGLDAGFYYRWK